MIGFWYTTYDGGFQATVWACSQEEAEELCRRRGMGEKVDTLARPSLRRSPNYPRASELLPDERRAPIERLHSVVFTLLLAYRSGVLDDPAVALLDDRGLLHECIHAVTMGPDVMARVVRDLQQIEEDVPGHLAPWERRGYSVREAMGPWESKVRAFAAQLISEEELLSPDYAVVWHGDWLAVTGPITPEQDAWRRECDPIEEGVRTHSTPEYLVSRASYTGRTACPRPAVTLLRFSPRLDEDSGGR